MATIKFVIFEGKAKENGECRVYCQISHKRKTSCIPTDVYVLPQHFHATRIMSGRNGDQNAGLKNIKLNGLENGYINRMYILGDKVDGMDILAIRKFLVSKSDIFYISDFFKYTEKRILELTEMKKMGTIGPLTATLARVREFHKKKYIDFSEITVKFLEEFISYYAQKEYKKNTIATYLAYIRAMFNDAIDEYNTNIACPIITNYPFRRIKIEWGKTINRNLGINTICQIRDSNFPTNKMEYARDMFMLQLYLMGINTKDLFYLTHKNLVSDRLQFNRHKTGHFYNMKVEPEAMKIINKYKGEKYLLWFADYCNLERNPNYKPHSRRSEFQYADSATFNKMLNEQLHKIKEYLELSLSESLTTYFSRHSFASIMREIGVSKDDISLCLGHKDPEQNLQVSSIYINEDFIKADIANRKFIDFINQNKYIPQKNKIECC